MALVFSDRVKETTTSTGTGPLTLAGAVAGFRAFSSVCADGDTAYYCVTDGTSWEVGLGTYAAGVLARTAVLSSSNAGALVALNPGPKDVYIDVPASFVRAILPASAEGDPISSGQPTDGSVVHYYDSDQQYTAYVFDAGSWHAVHAIDSTARSTAYIAAAAAVPLTPTFGSQDPVTAGAPTDGSVINWYDTSTSPWTAWVFGVAFDSAWHQVA